MPHSTWHADRQRVRRLKLSRLFTRKPAVTQPPASEGGQSTGTAGGRARTTFAASLTFEGVERRYDDTMALARRFAAISRRAKSSACSARRAAARRRCLRIASGIEKPSKGRVLISGQEVAGPNRFVPPEERHVGLMFQDFALFPHLTILENVAFGLKALAARRSRQGSPRGACSRRPRARYAASLSARSLGWRAAAGGAGPCVGAAALGRADGRAVLGARCAIAQPPAGGDAGAAA